LGNRNSKNGKVVQEGQFSIKAVFQKNINQNGKILPKGWRVLKAVRFRGADDLDGFLGEQMAVEERGGFKDELQRVASSFAELYTVRVAELDDVL
jgi:hypothetical protein